MYITLEIHDSEFILIWKYAFPEECRSMQVTKSTLLLYFYRLHFDDVIFFPASMDDNSLLYISWKWAA